MLKILMCRSCVDYVANTKLLEIV